MGTIIITNSGCQIADEKTLILRKIDLELSYKIQGAEFMRVPGWDGRKRLLTNNLCFPYGLLERVKELYARNEVELTIVDKREKSRIDPLDVLTPLKKMGKVPFDYQEEAANMVFQHDCGVYRMATGSGKTITMALMTAKLGKSTNIYVIGRDLLHQVYGLFKSLFPDVKVGIIGDGECVIGDINVVSVWTAGCALGLKKGKILNEGDNDEAEIEPEKYGKIRDVLKETKVHILDECHVAACDTIQNLAQCIRPEYIYGMSASPIRDDNADILIEGFLGRKIVDISASFLIKKGFLVKPNIKFLKVPKYPTKLPKSYPTIYRQYITENAVRNDLVLKGTQAMVDKGYQTLVLYNTISHGKILHDLISPHMPCMLLSGKDSQKIRDEAKEKITSKEINVIIASKIFDIGVDIPSMSGLVVASSGKSSVRALQRIGRVIRSYPNKKHAAVLDFYDDIHYLKDHSKARKDMYATEEEFNIQWVTT